MEDKKSDKFLEEQIIAALMKQTANKNLGITQEYNRENREKLWDSKKEKKDFKDKAFGDKNTYTDKINEQTLHKSAKAAKNKYHMKNEEGETISHKWAEHAAETDHINALKDVHDIAKYNPFLTDKDFKEIMNTEENYRVLSKSLNSSKSDKSDFKIIFDKSSEVSKAGKKQMAKEKITADIALQKKFAARTAKNIGVEFKKGASDTLISSVMPLTEKAIQNMIEVAQGQTKFEEAVENMGKAVLHTAVAGGKNQILLDIKAHKLEKDRIFALLNITESNQVSQLISVVTIVKDSALKYINGEIDKEQFIDEIGEKGSIIIAGMIGGVIGKEIGTIAGFALPLPIIGPIAGRVAGEILGTIITSLSCAVISAVSQLSLHIRSEMKNMDSYKKYEKQIRTLQNEALMEIEKQRKHFMEIAKRENAKLYEQIQIGFDTMLSCACEAAYDANGVTEGLDRILSVFGKSVRFRTLEEYEAQLDQPLKLSF